MSVNSEHVPWVSKGSNTPVNVLKARKLSSIVTFAHMPGGTSPRSALVFARSPKSNQLPVYSPSFKSREVGLRSRKEAACFDGAGSSLGTTFKASLYIAKRNLICPIIMHRLSDVPRDVVGVAAMCYHGNRRRLERHGASIVHLGRLGTISPKAADSITAKEKRAGCVITVARWYQGSW